jgi:hypothetical protein
VSEAEVEKLHELSFPECIVVLVTFEFHHLDRKLLIRKGSLKLDAKVLVLFNPKASCFGVETGRGDA